MFTQSQLIATAPNLHKFALRLTRNGADADDLLQSTLLRAIEKQNLFESGTNLFSWSSKIMFNIFASGYRRRTKFETQYDPQTVLDSLATEPTQEASCDLKQVATAMTHLSREHREILTLVCVQGVRYEEAGERLGIPVGTVRSRLSRARDSLQKLMDTPLDPAYIAAHNLQHRGLSA